MRHSLTAALAALLLAACAHTPSGDAVLAPNPHLRAEGIPPVPQAMVRTVERYTEFAGHAVADWHPTQRELLVAHRAPGTSTTQLFRLRTPLGELEPLTSGAEPVSRGRWEPGAGRYIVIQRASGGNEVNQLLRLDPTSRAVTLLTDPDARHAFGGWLRPEAGQPSRLLLLSVPLDRTAAQGSRAQITTTLSVLDPEQPAARRVLTALPGGGWRVGAVAPGNRQLVLDEYVSATESRLWLLDVVSGQRTRLLPREGQPAAAYGAVDFTADGRALMLTTDQGGEFRQLARLELATGALTPLSAHIPWDVEDADLSTDGRWLAAASNEDGLSVLRLFDVASGRERPLTGLPEGAASPARFHAGSGELALTVNGAAGPGQIYSRTADGTLTQWTRAVTPPGVDTARFQPQKVVRWTSFDGRTISGLLTRPDPARFPGKRPVYMLIHGGPEGQASVGFMGRWNYLLEELGVAVLQPNVRGSSGYGRTFLQLDNGARREDSVKDIGALFDWIAAQSDLDASRVVVAGGSYGGYMSLATSVHYPERIVGAIDVVGISHFVTFLESTESYRRDLRRVEYGDERDPAMRALQERISPLTNASRITRPLFVIQGKNDPRVPWTEAEQIVAKARANGTPVWYLLADNEGHGFVRKENADFQFYATLLFLRQTLLPPSGDRPN